MTVSAISPLAAQVVARCRVLSKVGRVRGSLTRPYASHAMAQANALVGTWMREAGLEVRLDAAGNLVGRLRGTDPQAGSQCHTP